MRSGLCLLVVAFAIVSVTAGCVDQACEGDTCEPTPATTQNDEHIVPVALDPDRAQPTLTAASVARTPNRAQPNP